MSKKSILIVEDDFESAEFLKLNLMAKGYDVTGIAESGKKAIARIPVDKPDLVIMGVMLEGLMDGIEASNLIRKQYNIPTLYITAHASDELFKRPEFKHPFSYILKPVDDQVLEISIAIALYRHELESRLQNCERGLSDAQRIGNMGSWDWDILNDRFICSDNALNIFGIEPRSFNDSLDDFLTNVHFEDQEFVQTSVDKTLAGDQAFDIRHRVMLPDGQTRFVKQSATVLLNNLRKPIRMQATIQDVTDLHAAEEAIKELAYYDTVTGLPNRTLFFDRMGQSISRFQRQHRICALMRINLDNFKDLNDNFGHQAGDRLLRELGERFKETLREMDTISRTGGLEFSVIVQDVKAPDGVVVVANKLLEACARPFDIDDSEIRINCSIGVSMSYEAGGSVDNMLKLAEKAMYAANTTGVNQFKFSSDPNDPQWASIYDKSGG